MSVDNQNPLYYQNAGDYTQSVVLNTRVRAVDPTFMPDTTAGVVKALTPEQATHYRRTNYLNNTYHFAFAARR